MVPAVVLYILESMDTLGKRTNERTNEEEEEETGGAVANARLYSDAREISGGTGRSFFFP